MKLVRRLIRYYAALTVLKALINHKKYVGYNLEVARPKMIKDALDTVKALEEALRENDAG